MNVAYRGSFVSIFNVYFCIYITRMLNICSWQVVSYIAFSYAELHDCYLAFLFGNKEIIMGQNYILAVDELEKFIRDYLVYITD